MALRTTHGKPTAESVTDTVDWLHALTGCPPIAATHVARCSAHETDDAVWFYVEADAARGVARLRCLACGREQHLTDSAERWSYPQAWACTRCAQSIAEVVLGAHTGNDPQVADWVALAVRCVDCGTIAGLTDVVLPPPGLPLDQVLRTD
jgi:hypothetical protein